MSSLVGEYTLGLVSTLVGVCNVGGGPLERRRVKNAGGKCHVDKATALLGDPHSKKNAGAVTLLVSQCVR